MRKKLVIIGMSLLVCCALIHAQEAGKNELQERAESEYAKGNSIAARALYIKAFESYVNNGKLKQGVDCGVKANKLYYEKENLYKEAFDLLRRIDQTIEAKGQGANKSALHYWTSKERHLMYMKMRKLESAKEQMGNMENHATAANDASVNNDLLYTKTIYYYTIGQTDKGNATFKEMADQLTASKEYGKVDEVYQTLIANGRKSNSANLVAESYKSYLAWKDSASALALADTVGVLKKQIADNEAEIEEKDSSLTARQVTIVGLGILAAVLAVVLVLGALALLRSIYLTRKQKKTINSLSENNALQAKFISNISAQLSPTLQKLDKNVPEVKALQDFSEHIQTLSELESNTGTAEKVDVQVSSLCDGLMDQIRNKVKSGVNLKVDAPKMTASINKEYVSHILLHLLHNAAIYTPADGHIALEYKKRGAHKHQFLVSNTGSTIPEEQREEVFKPFREVRDLTQGDGLGLPICKQMDGDLDIDPAFTKGVRFVLHLTD